MSTKNKIFAFRELLDRDMFSISEVGGIAVYYNNLFFLFKNQLKAWIFKENFIVFAY